MKTLREVLWFAVVISAFGVLAAPARACGMVTHGVIVERAIDQLDARGRIVDRLGWRRCASLASS
jgi:hypothetical protein